MCKKITPLKKLFIKTTLYNTIVGYKDNYYIISRNNKISKSELRQRIINGESFFTIGSYGKISEIYLDRNYNLKTCPDDSTLNNLEKIRQNQKNYRFNLFK
jgi:hypothetical protein